MSKTTASKAIQAEYELVIAKANKNLCRELAEILDEQSQAYDSAFALFTESELKAREVYYATIASLDEKANSRKNNCAPYWRNRTNPRQHVAYGYLPCTNLDCSHASQSRLALSKFVNHDGLSDTQRCAQPEQFARCENYCIGQILALKDEADKIYHTSVETARLDLDNVKKTGWDKVVIRQKVAYAKFRRIEASAIEIMQNLDNHNQIAIQQLKDLAN